MNVSIGKRWEDFVEEMVKEGTLRFAGKIVREGLRWSKSVRRN